MPAGGSAKASGWRVGSKRIGVDVIDCSSGGTLGPLADGWRARQEIWVSGAVCGKDPPRGRHHDHGRRPHRARGSGRGDPAPGVVPISSRWPGRSCTTRAGQWMRRRNLALIPVQIGAATLRLLAGEARQLRVSRARHPPGARAWAKLPIGDGRRQRLARRRRRGEIRSAHGRGLRASTDARAFRSSRRSAIDTLMAIPADDGPGGRMRIAKGALAHGQRRNLGDWQCLFTAAMH